MSNLKLDFATEAEGTTLYRINCINNSTANLIFYVYQTMPSQPSNVFSLAWLASPYKLGLGYKISFTWSVDYSFVWGNTGTLTPGVNFYASQRMSCSPTGPNMSTFSLDNFNPQLSTPVTGGQVGSLTIHGASNVPNMVFSTGIGMSGYGVFAQQALANVTQLYTPTPNYWIAAANNMQAGQVLGQWVNLASPFSFPPNMYTANATLNPDNTWTISYQ